MGHYEAGTYSVSRACQIATTGARCLGQLIVGLHLYDCLHAWMYVCVADRGCTLCIDVIVWATFTLACVLFGLNSLSYSYYDKLHVTWIFNRMNLFWGSLNFSGSVCLARFKSTIFVFKWLSYLKNTNLLIKYFIIRWSGSVTKLSDCSEALLSYSNSA